MSKRILISAVIPTYNRERTLKRALDSVQSQSYPAAEILVVDDGSNDGTRDVVAAYENGLRYIYQSNQGVAAARNRLVCEAKYDWIAFLDSDDYWLPDHLKRIVEAIEATKGEAALYFSDVMPTADDGVQSLWKFCKFEPHAPFELRRDAGDWVLNRIQPMMLQASIIRRDKFTESGGLPPGLQTKEDTLLFFKLGLLYPACAVSGCGAVMTPDGDSRLTIEMHSGTVEYSLATISVFKAVLALGKAINAERRRVVSSELSGAYFGAGRVLYREHEFLRSMICLVQSAVVRPRVFVSCFLGTLRRRIVRWRPSSA